MLVRRNGDQISESPPNGKPKKLQWYPILIGLATAIAIVVLGNLGTVKMIYQGYQRLAAPEGKIEDSTLVNRLTWSVEGFGKVLSGDALPYGIGDWYWNPSRAIPAPNDVEPITEFPFFTVLYGDPHAHLFAIPIALLALAWIVGVLLGKGKWKNFLAAACSFFIGALAIGALQPTNTFDMYTYLPLAVVVIAYTFLCYFEISPRSLQRWTFLKGVPTWLYRCVAAVLAILALLVLSRLLYQPFRDWFTLGYTRVDLWEGTRTPLVAYLTHWGLFLFVIVSWMVWETYHWMASTPLASVRKLEPYRGLIFLGALIVLLTMFAIIALGGKIAWLVYPWLPGRVYCYYVRAPQMKNDLSSSW